MRKWLREKQFFSQPLALVFVVFSTADVISGIVLERVHGIYARVRNGYDVFFVSTSNLEKQTVRQG